MAIAFRALGDGVGTNNSPTITLNAPTGVQSTDIVLACLIVAGGSSITITPPSGWTLVNRLNDGTKSGQAVYWALGNVASYQFTVTQISDSNFGYTIAYSG